MDIPMGAEGIAVVWDRMQAAEYKLRQIGELIATWAVDDDTYLHLDGQDLGYADAAVQVAAVINA